MLRYPVIHLNVSSAVKCCFCGCTKQTNKQKTNISPQFNLLSVPHSSRKGITLHQLGEIHFVYILDMKSHSINDRFFFSLLFVFFELAMTRMCTVVSNASPDNICNLFIITASRNKRIPNALKPTHAVIGRAVSSAEALLRSPYFDFIFIFDVKVFSVYFNVVRERIQLCSRFPELHVLPCAAWFLVSFGAFDVSDQSLVRHSSSVMP